MISEPGPLDGAVPRRRAATRSRSTSRSTRRRSGPRWRRIREAGRSAGLSVKPGDAAHGARRLPGPARHRAGDDRRARVRRPGVHGATSPTRSSLPARAWLDPAGACEVQLDGGGRAETAEVIGRGGTDVIVAGSALYRAPDMAAEVERIRSIADAARAATLARRLAAGQRVRALLQRVSRAEVRVDGARRGLDRARAAGPAGRGPRRRRGRRPTRSRAGSASCGSSRMTRAGRTARCSTSTARRWS